MMYGGRGVIDATWCPRCLAPKGRRCRSGLSGKPMRNQVHQERKDKHNLDAYAKRVNAGRL